MLRQATALLLVIVMVAGAAGPVAADHDEEDDSITEDILGSEGSIVGMLSGVWNRYVTDFGTPDVSATEACNDLQSTVNQHNQSLQSYVNDRASASADHDVLEVQCVIDGEEATKYVVADVTGGAYENASMVDGTDRSVDETCRLSDDAAANAASEVETFHEQFASTGDNVSAGFRSRLTAQYAGDVSCTFL